MAVIPTYVRIDRFGFGFLQCGSCQAIIEPKMIQYHNNFHETFSNRIGQDMSRVLWCDPGNHAFKAGSPGSVNFQGSQTEENGAVTTTDVDACAEHNPFRATPDVRTMLTADGHVAHNID